MSLQTFDGYVLHRIDRVNKTLQLALWHRDEGVLRAISSRRMTPEQLRHIRLFQHLQFSAAPARHPCVIQGCTAVAKALCLQGLSLYIGWYLNELTYRLLMERALPAALFMLYEQQLRWLADWDGDEESMAVWLRIYELNLLTYCGAAPDFNHDRYGDLIQADRYYDFSVTDGFVAIDSDSRHTLTPILSGRHLLELSQQIYSTQALQIWRYVHKCILRAQLKGQPIHSEQLIKRYMKDFKSS